MSTARRNVKQLRAGQWFIWCGRAVMLIRATDHEGDRDTFARRGRRSSRASRRLIVTCEGSEKALHYFDVETVEVCDPPREHELARLEPVSETASDAASGTRRAGE